MYFSIPNNRATTVVRVDDPSALPPPDYAQFNGDKKAFRLWCQNRLTQHHFLSCCEGVTDGLRVSADNQIYRVHGLLVDYDAAPPDAAIEHLKRNMAAEFLPTWFVSTFSGHCRLVWEFEYPFYPIGTKHYKAFIQNAAKSLCLNAWLPGLDAGSLGDPSHYYEQGVWQRVSDTRIPSAHVELWTLSAASQIVLPEATGALDYSIPMDRIAAEVEARYPNKWTSVFEAGARGPAFWSVNGGSANCCVLFSEGVYCFSETVGAGFYTWERIFGKGFVEQFETDKVKEILNEPIYYDGQHFWRSGDDGTWDCINKQDYTQELRLRGFSGKIARGETFSQIDKIETMVKTAKRVAAAVPFLYYPEGRIYYEGERYLNTCRVRPLSPAPPFGEPATSLADCRRKFPFLYKLLTTMFYIEANDPKNPDDEVDYGTLQLERFLAWLKFFYVQSWKQDPRPGHAIVLAGPPDKGKTFLFKHVLSKLMGGALSGSSDGTGHLAGGERWTERLIRTPLILIDDNLMSADPREVTRFTARVKKYVSSPTMIYEQKFRAQAELPWLGRIVVLCNTDAESLRMLPGMSLSVRDKISLFKASEARMQFGTWAENQKLVLEELPNFARFLIDWIVPDRSAAQEGNDRFGVKAFHHPDLMNESLQSGLDGIVLDLLSHMMEELGEHDKVGDGEKVWTGTYTALYNQLAVLYERIMYDIKPRALAICLGNLSRNGYDISQIRNPKRLGGDRLWRIGSDLYRNLRNKGADEDEMIAREEKKDAE